MRKIILNATDKTLEAVLDSTPSLALQYTATWADATATALTESSSDGTIPTTTSTVIVAAPASGVRRAIIDFSVYNPNSVLVAGSLVYQQGANGRIITRFRLSPNEVLTTEGVFTASGRLRTESSSGEREVLTAPRTYFVRTDGNNNNSGLANTASGAFLTIQRAIDVAASLDLSIFNVTIQVADGTYATPNILKSYVGAGKLIVQGNTSNPTAVVVTTSTPATHCFYFLGQTLGIFRFTHMRLSTSGSAECCLDQSLGYGFMEFDNIDFGSSVAGHIRIGSGGQILSTGNYSISGSSIAHAQAYDSGFIRLGAASGLVTLTGTPNFGSAFVVADRGASILTVNQTYTGSATGARYTASSFGKIFQVGGSTNFPGSIAGTPVPNPTEAQLHAVNYGFYKYN